MATNKKLHLIQKIQGLTKKKTISIGNTEKLPSEIQVTLYLIKEELKSRKFFRTLQDMGLDDCHFQPHLDTQILNSLGMDEDTGEIFDAYYEIMQRRSQKIDAGNDSIMTQALEAYHELLAQKRKQAWHAE